MSKHTPGPWHVANGCQIRSDKHQVAKAWMMRDGEGLANAALIAAAPSLLEALIDVADDYSERFDMDSPSTNPGMKIVVENARTAIAKARGEA